MRPSWRRGILRGGRDGTVACPVTPGVPSRPDAGRGSGSSSVAAGLVVLGFLVLVACRRVTASGATAAAGRARAPRPSTRSRATRDARASRSTSCSTRRRRRPVSVTVATADGTAKVADHDYEAMQPTVTFAPGQTARTVTVLVDGDTKLEDYETFTVRLDERGRRGARPRDPDRARAQRRATERAWPATSASVRVACSRSTPGCRAATTDPSPPRWRRSTRARRRRPTTPRSDRRWCTRPDRHASVPVGVTTAADSLTEPPETFRLRVQSTDLAGTLTATGTIVETQCPSGSPATAAALAAAPASSSSPRPSAPPASVTGTDAWDVVFRDDFDRSDVTASKWSTGMRTGALTLEGNHELEWYTPGNSVLTTDTDAGQTVSVLQQRLTAQPVSGTYYPVGILSRVYPPARCPQYYDPQHLGPDDDSLVPYRFRSGMLNSAKSFAFKYGYVEARVRMPKGFALWPALWLRDWKGWSYELDALEGFDRDARTFRGTYWWGNGSNVSTSADGDLGVNADGSPCRGESALARDVVDLGAVLARVERGSLGRVPHRRAQLDADALRALPRRGEAVDVTGGDADRVRREPPDPEPRLRQRHRRVRLEPRAGAAARRGSARRRRVPEADGRVGLRAGVAAGRPPRRLHDRQLLTRAAELDVGGQRRCASRATTSASDRDRVTSSSGWSSYGSTSTGVTPAATRAVDVGGRRVADVDRVLGRDAAALERDREDARDPAWPRRRPTSRGPRRPQRPVRRRPDRCRRPRAAPRPSRRRSRRSRVATPVRGDGAQRLRRRRG